MASRKDLNADQLSIDTPELVPIQVPLAGIGSRFAALLLDSLIWLIAVLALSFLSWLLRPALGAFSMRSAQWAAALYVFAIFVLNWGYFTLFEAFWNGRTPGKRIAGIRVIQSSGRAIGLFESMARNLIRYVDQIPFCYAVGAIAVFANRQHQRLGDLAAGTLVVRDESGQIPLWADLDKRYLRAQQFPLSAPGNPLPSLLPVPPSALTPLTTDDLAVLEGFFARRVDLPTATREELASRIAVAIQQKCGFTPPPGFKSEELLEIVAYQLRERSIFRPPGASG
jgi:uncharacterized RDD family membrane protein YckC